MTNKVGTKGQIVIEKPIRDQLGIEPGQIAVQSLSGDHVEIRFFPPDHERSLRGLLADPSRPTVASTEWDDAKRQAWKAAALVAEAPDPED